MAVLPQRINIQTALAMAGSAVFIDVRSPGEFQKGHIPGAVNIPLFTDEERARVGTLYKQNGKDAAVYAGLDFAGSKLKEILREARKHARDKNSVIHCWRGGMRSGSVAWLLSFAGMEISILEGGYKAFRRAAASCFQAERIIHVLGGSTGSGKTGVLSKLQEHGEACIDLEALACHKGSAFGSLGMSQQPTVEQFENNLFTALRLTDPAKPLWLEDENQAIGRVFIPFEFYRRMEQAKFFLLDVPLEVRVKRLTEEYGQFSQQELNACFEKIRKRLGGQHFKAATEALTAGKLEEAARISLTYYDKAYQHKVAEKRKNPFIVDTHTGDSGINAQLVLDASTKIYGTD